MEGISTEQFVLAQPLNLPDAKQTESVAIPSEDVVMVPQENGENSPASGPAPISTAITTIISHFVSWTIVDLHNIYRKFSVNE